MVPAEERLAMSAFERCEVGAKQLENVPSSDPEAYISPSGEYEMQWTGP